MFFPSLKAIMKQEISRHLEIIKENSVDLINEAELVAKLEKSLRTKQPLKIKIGFDPTARDIHLGHSVLLRKLRKLQDLSHQVYFIIGDFTAKIGDPSQKNTQRPLLSDKEIKANAATYTSQAFKLLDKTKTTIIYNSIWYKNMLLADFLALLSSYTVARILERDDFSRRLNERQPLSLLEVIYPLIQGYDSCKIKADLELGGTDQKFNLIVGRHLQEAFCQSPQVAVTMPILTGTDGQNKMSKSLGNYIGITDAPKDMFGKIMSISDELMQEYIRLLYDGNPEELKHLHPKEAKIILAKAITAFYHSKPEAEKAALEFERVFSKKGLPENIPIYKSQEQSINVLEVLTKSSLVSSRNEARRLLQQKAISIIEVAAAQKENILRSQTFKLPSAGIILKVGKKKFLKIILK